MGCHLDVNIPDEGEWIITGNQCKRGISYAQTELTNPCRVLTSTVKISDGFLNRVPVRTTDAIPKGLIFEAMKEINKVDVPAPVKMGQILITDLLGTGVDVVASRSMNRSM
jgi:CxxC motif-containing protein